MIIGSKELKQARVWLVKYSLSRAQLRLQKERGEYVASEAAAAKLQQENQHIDVDPSNPTQPQSNGITATTITPNTQNNFPANNNNNNNTNEASAMVIDGTKKRRTLHDWQRTFEFFTNTSSQVGDERPIGYCRLSPDNNTLATAGWSGLIKLWNVDSCAEKFTFKGHSDRANCVLYHPLSGIQQAESTANLASCGADGVVNIWSLNQTNPMISFKSHSAKANRIAFHPSGRFLGSTSDDMTWKLFDLEVGKEILDQEGHSRGVFGISFHIDGSIVATGGNDKITRVWDLRSGKSIWVIKGHSKRVLDIDWSSNGHYIATASEDNSVHISDIRTKRLLYPIPAHQNLVSHVRFIESGELIFTSSFDHTCKIFSTRDWSPIKAIGGNEKVMCCDLASDFSKLVTANYDRTWRVFVKDKVAWERESGSRKEH
jgi:U4/U6 small nuclear ribonucleoprotein PRP4